MNKLFDGISCDPVVVASRYEGCRIVAAGECRLPEAAGGTGEIRCGDAVWSCESRIIPVLDRPDAVDVNLQFRMKAGNGQQMAMGLELKFSAWSRETYVLVPGMAYNGNRFECRPLDYPPLVSDSRDMGPDTETVITDVPRLNVNEGPSRMQLTTQDPATPAIGFHNTDTCRGFLLLTDQRTRLGKSLLSIEESEDRRQAVIRLTAPCVRQQAYKCFHLKPSEDRAADFQVGDELTLRMRVFAFDCPTVQGLFDRFAVVRKDLSGSTSLKHELPFSAAWAIQEEKYNRDNWEAVRGYYSVGLRNDQYQDWQVGWVGGGMATLPLIFAGGEKSRERSFRTIDFMMRSQTESGFFHGTAYQGQWLGDGLGHEHAVRWHMTRKSADALYFLVKQFDLLQRQDAGWRMPSHWEQGVRRLADAFVRMWNKYGQFGQFVDVHTGELVVGGSASAAIATAGLVLASKLLKSREYLRVAKDATDLFYERFVRRGLTNGGPGEILQNPDSESAFAVLESFVSLYEATGDRMWLGRAEEMAKQYATWVVSYDYEFPENSTFGRLGIRTTGSVIANVQNKHSAPGICTMSGNALFRLFRATGNMFYLELLRDTAHNLTQYLSRSDRLINARHSLMQAGNVSDGKKAPPGWMNERVNMSDWEGEENIGEIFYGPCWSEVSLMLTYVEVPGVYVQPDTGFVFALDHVNARMLKSDADSVDVELMNPTMFDAWVRVFVENSEECGQALEMNSLWGRPQYEVAAGQTLVVNLMS